MSRPTHKQKEAREMAKKHHVYDCVTCGSKRQLQVHHVDGDWKNNSPVNLCWLCQECHTHTHKGVRVFVRAVRLYQAITRIRNIRPIMTW